jgi:Holliday junction resolvase RusA-like endonuclease
MTVTVMIPRPPSTNGLFSGAGKKRVRSPVYRQWTELAGWELARQRPAKTAGAVSILVEVEEPSRGRRSDIDNRLKAAIDLLVTHSLIESDDQFTVRKVTGEWSKEVTGARVTIEPWGGA